MKNLFCLTILFLFLGVFDITKAKNTTMKAQGNTAEKGTLSAKQQSIATILLKNTGKKLKFNCSFGFRLGNFS